MDARIRFALLLLPLALAACGGGGARVSYRPVAGRNYTPPGPPGDPWGPYIREAASRYAIPERWIREVMRQESGGHEYLNGEPITSAAGAMGLMQVMPATYAELAGRYGLGGDPYDPHDNIMAGSAYISELAARYGSPGFLAAYNAGPGRLDDYMAGRSSLPNETLAYLDNVAPRLVGSGPMTGPLVAFAGTAASEPAPAPEPAAAAPVEVAEAPPVTQPGSVLWSPAQRPAQTPQYAPPAYAPPAYASNAYAPPPQPAAPPPRRTGFALIPSAYADTPARNTEDARWGVQVGAFSEPAQAHQVAESARAVAPQQLAPAHTVVASVVHADGAVFYRARLIGITEPAADTVCGKLAARQWPCLAVPPGG